VRRREAGGSRLPAAALLSLALLAGSCATPARSWKDTDFHVGMTRAAVLAQFGAPDSKQSMLKSNEHVFGPIETFWGRVPMGAKVEIWSYRSQQWPNGRAANPTEGSTELYFVAGSDTVDGIGFAVAGAVY
jgi:hypothetical protein